MGWTEDRVIVLKNLWAEGLSASQIAKQLGGGVTRNAVIGKVHRLGLAGRATPSRPAKRPVRVARPRPIVTGTPMRPRPAPVQPHVQAAPPLEPMLRPDGKVVTVLTLNEGTCRWPIGDPSSADFAFCGRHPAGGPYCSEHNRLAYQPQTPKKKKPYGEPDELRRLLRYSMSL
jgi:GcrA cell cycle regulator